MMLVKVIMRMLNSLSLLASYSCLFLSLPLLPVPQASERVLPYPAWALALLSLLILLACLPLPMLYIHTLLRRHLGSEGDPLEAGLSHRDTYVKCETDEPAAAQQLIPLEEEQEAGRASFLSLGAEHYRLLPQKDLVEEDIEEDTGV